MNIEEAGATMQAIESSREKQLRLDLYTLCVRYAAIRADWRLAERAERRRMERLRTATHNALIDACNSLARKMAKQGEDASWRERLGNDRREIGDLACYLSCLLGISAR
ncbi:MAG: hypothetical protein KAY32_04525 [Candidatus Eisenbacteria sp.]|nr:hypothetical protein [Candidatus Eisenbacteria bacterium]